MRLLLLPLCLIATGLTGCVTQYKPAKPFPGNMHTRHKISVKKPIPHPAPVQLYTDPAELVSKPFRDLGEVTGEDCQSTAQDSPASIPTARRRMQTKTATLKANAVLVHQCEVISANSACYRQAICQGSALKVNQ